MKGHGSKFGRKMEAAVAALLTQRNVEEAARTVGVSVPTLMRWQKLSEFQAAYREARRMAYSQAVAKLQQGTTAAATTPAQGDARPGYASVRAGPRRRVHHEPLR